MQTREYAIAVENWLDNVFTEVRSHDGGYLRALKHKNELRGGEIQFYYEFDDELEFKKTDIILDVGSGVRPICGNYREICSLSSKNRLKFLWKSWRNIIHPARPEFCCPF